MSIHRHITAVLALAAAACGATGQTPAAWQGLDGRALLPAEGVWQFPDDGATLMIQRTSADALEITLLDSPDLSAQVPSVIGHARVTPAPGVYDATFSGGALPQAGATATLHVSDGVLSVRPYSKGWTVSFKRLFYRLFRISVSRHDTRPDNLDGAVRIYPDTPTTLTPVCL